MPGPSLLDARRDPYDGDECIHRIKLRINDISQHHQQQRFCVKLTLLDSQDRALGLLFYIYGSNVKDTIYSTPIRVVSKSSLINGVRSKRGIPAEPDQPLPPPRQRSRLSLSTPTVAPCGEPPVAVDASEHSGAAVVLAELSNSLRAKAMDGTESAPGSTSPPKREMDMTGGRVASSITSTPPTPVCPPRASALSTPSVPSQPPEGVRETAGPRTLQQDVRLLHVVCAELQSQVQRLQTTLSTVLQKQDEILGKLDK